MTVSCENKTAVYCLIDPRVQRLFYIGVSIHPSRRYIEHVCSNKPSFKRNVITAIQKAGRTPELLILGWFEECRALQLEQQLIAMCRAIPGLRLTNIESGGRKGKTRIQTEQEKTNRNLSMASFWNSSLGIQERLRRSVKLQGKRPATITIVRNELYNAEVSKAVIAWKVSNLSHDLAKIKVTGYRCFASVSEACRELTVHNSAVHKVLGGKIKTTGGWHFEYC